MSGRQTPDVLCWLSAKRRLTEWACTWCLKLFADEAYSDLSHMKSTQQLIRSREFQRRTSTYSTIVIHSNIVVATCKCREPIRSVHHTRYHQTATKTCLLDKQKSILKKPISEQQIFTHAVKQMEYRCRQGRRLRKSGSES